MDYFDKTYHPPGTPPGTLVIAEGVVLENLNLTLIDYSHTDYTETILSVPDECKPYLTKESISWIHVQGQVSVDILKKIGITFDIHTLALEDILNKGQRPKIEEYDELLFIILAMPIKPSDEKLVDIEQVSLFLGKNFIISFHNGNDDFFAPLRQRLRKKTGRIRSLGADYLLYCILDLVIDQGYPMLESFGERMEIIEEELLASNTKQTTLNEIHKIRRELLIIRRNLWPQREMLSNLFRNESALISEGTLIYLRDCYDHTVQILDILENYREMATSLVDVYLSTTSNRLNEIMRVLTMIATVFIPLTFIVGLYGMNFSHPNSPWAMPELHWYYGYPTIWGIMIVIVLGMIFYFKRKNWL